LETEVKTLAAVKCEKVIRTLSRRKESDSSANFVTLAAYVHFISLMPMLAISLGLFPGSPAFAFPEKSAQAGKNSVAAASLNITAAPYFAKGDGLTDNTAAINQALGDAAASTPRRNVYVPLGTFIHSGVLHIRGVTLSGAGGGTVIQATNPSEGACELSGKDSGIQNCTLVSPAAKDRMNSSHSAAICVNGATKFTINKVNVGAEGMMGAASAGILCADRASSQGVITGNRILNTLADGIHLTAGAKDIQVSGNTLTNTGDDMIAVVSYRKDGTLVSGVRITKNVCVRQTNGRGISVVGGNDVIIDHNIIQSSDAAGIYIASEDSYDTFAPSNVQVIGNIIRNANQRHTVTHGGIYVFGRAASENGAAVPYFARNITISGNTLTNTYYMGIRIGGYAVDVRITGNHVIGTTAEGIAVSDTGDRSAGAGAQNVLVSGNTIDATKSGAIKVFPSMWGALTITDNRLSNADTSNNPGVDVIFIDAQAIAIRPLKLTGNRYVDAGGHPVRSYINCQISAADAGTSALAIRESNTTTVAPSKPVLLVP